jgi:hypothetical protein
VDNNVSSNKKVMTKLDKVKQCLEALKAFNDDDDKKQRPSDKERFHVKYESPFMYYLWMAQNNKT